MLSPTSEKAAPTHSRAKNKGKQRDEDEKSNNSELLKLIK